MKNTYLLFVFILFFYSCDDERKSTAPDNNQALKGIIKGIVIDSISQEPVAEAIISTLPLTTNTKSQSDGSFELNNLSPSLTEIVISHPDYIPYSNIVKVGAGITNNIQFQIKSLAILNTPPNIPDLISPIRGTTILGYNMINFRWNTSNNDNDNLLFDLYLSEVNSEFKMVAQDISKKFYTLQYDFIDDAEYQWYIVAKDRFSETRSNIRTFMFQEIVDPKIPDLYAFWKLNNEVNDHSQNSFGGTAENVEFVSDRNSKPNSAAYFKGNISNVSKVLLPSSLQLTDEFTIALWIKQDLSKGENSNNGFYECISKWGINGLERSSWAFGINKDSYLFIATYSNVPTIKIATSVRIPTNTWQHIAVSFSEGSASFYLNGILIDQVQELQIPQVSSYQASIGGRQDQVSSFHGAIDDVYLYKRALNESEILKLTQE